MFSYRNLGPIIILVFYGSSYLGRWEWGGLNDWNNFEIVTAIGRYFYVLFGEFPQWDAYRCGGVPYLANPEHHAFSPFFILHVLFGVHGGLKLLVLIHFIIGFLGMYKWLSLYIKDSFSIFFASLFFCLNGNWVANVSVGHLGWVALAYIPWQIYFYEKLWRNYKDAIWGIILFYILLFTIGSPNFLMMFSVISIIWFFSKTLRFGINTKFIKILIAGIVISLIIVSPVILPVLDWISEHPRSNIFNFNDAPKFFSLIETFFIPLKRDYNYQIGNWEDWHYYNYVGAIVIFLFLFALIFDFKRVKEQKEYLVIFVISFLLALGHFSPWAPYSILKKIPLFDALRVPSKYFLYCTIVVFFYSSFGLERIKHLFEEKNKAAFYPYFCFGLLLLNLFLNYPSYIYFKQTWAKEKNISHLSRQTVETSKFSHHMAKPYRVNDVYRFKEKILTPNRGVINCINSFAIPPHRVYIGPLIHPYDGELKNWTPHRFTVKLGEAIRSKTKSSIVLNMTCLPKNWSTTHGKFSCSDMGLLRIDGIAGVDEIALNYSNRLFHISLILSTIGLILLFSYFLWRFLKKER